MSLKLMAMTVLFLLVIAVVQVSAEDMSFIFNKGFQSANLAMDGLASITSNGLLQFTNETQLQNIGHAFYPYPVVFTRTFCFSTTFVFTIRTHEYPSVSDGYGMAFVISPAKSLSGSAPSPGKYLGLLNETTNGKSSNHVLAVELDTNQNPDFGDINDNHVGIDINDLKSANSTPAGYYQSGDGFQFQFKNLSLVSGLPMQVWVRYDGRKKQISVSLAPINVNKPEIPLLTLSQLDLSQILTNLSYVGFSASSSAPLNSHYVLGWSFQINGEAQDLVDSELPTLPTMGGKGQSMILPIGLPLVSLTVLVSLSIIYYIIQKRKFSEVVEEWEQDYRPHRFKYKDLYVATKGFTKKELLGCGGFGEVYKGIMPSSKIEVAVKKVSHESQQGMREFVVEIVSIGRLRHRNLVSLLGYCKRKEEILLVYDFMPNGSLDKYLYNQPKVTLNWKQRFKIIKGVALGLCYLHEEWEQVVVHRDVKASNVLLDSEFNAKLGDFGLARLYDHGNDPATTLVVGTLGYLAPENTRTGKATTKSDVFAFGAFMLEVVCGRRPIDLVSEDMVLVDWVYALWKRGEIIKAKDQNLGADYNTEEVELVLKMGLWCSNSKSKNRPSMRQVVQYLNNDVPLPDLTSLISPLSYSEFAFGSDQESDDMRMRFQCSNMDGHSSCSISITESVLSGGR